MARLFDIAHIKLFILGTGSVLNLTGNITISVFVRRSSSAAGTIISTRDTNNTGMRLGFGAGDPATVQFSPDILSPDATSAAALGTGTWQHVAAVVNGFSVRVYLDAVAGADFSITGIASAGTAEKDIAGYDLGPPASPNANYDGALAHLAVWNRALSPAQIATLAAYVSPLQYPQNLVVYYPLNELHTGDAVDLGPNNLLAQNVNAPGFEVSQEVHLITGPGLETPIQPRLMRMLGLLFSRPRTRRN